MSVVMREVRVSYRLSVTAYYMDMFFQDRLLNLKSFAITLTTLVTQFRHHAISLDRSSQCTLEMREKRGPV